MKKVIVFLLALSLLCGCTSLKETNPIVNDIAFTANIKYQKQKYVCDIQSYNDGINLIIKEPQNIEGLVFDINKNGCKMEFEGLAQSYDIDLLPYNSFAQIIYDVFSEVATQTIDINNKNCEIEGNVNNKKYVFLFSPSGLPLSLEIKDLDFYVKFSSVTIK